MVSMKKLSLQQIYYQIQIKFNCISLPKKLEIGSGIKNTFISSKIHYLKFLSNMTHIASNLFFSCSQKNIRSVFLPYSDKNLKSFFLPNEFICSFANFTKALFWVFSSQLLLLFYRLEVALWVSAQASAKPRIHYLGK